MNPNETYYILIDSYSALGSGSYTIDVQCFDENIFDIPQSTSTIICPYTQGIISCNTKVNGIITNGAEYCYTFIPHYVSTVTFSNCESNFDTTLFVYNKNAEEISQPYCDGDDCGSCGTNEQFSIPQMNPNETYYILIDSYSALGSGSYTIDVQCFDENIFDNTTTNILINGYGPWNYSYQCGVVCDECVLGYFNVSADLDICSLNTVVTCSAQNEVTLSEYGNDYCVGPVVYTITLINGCNYIHSFESEPAYYVFLEFECTPTWVMSDNTTIGPNHILYTTTTFIQTISKPLCEADKCYYEYVKQTNIMTQIINYDNINAYLFDIYYLFEDYECNNPRLTFEYEKIDIDRVSEYISISANDTFIAECGTGVNKCGEMKQCFSNKTFGINIISIGESLKISIVVSKNSNALCETDMHQIYTINGELTLICNDKITSINNNNSNNSLFIKMNININTIIIFSVCICFICILLFTIVWCCRKNRKQKHKQSEDEILDYIDSQLEMTHNKTSPIMNDEQEMMEDDQILQQMHDTILLDEETTL
eukprot:481836_1